LFNSVVDNTDSGGVINMYRCRRLWESKILKDKA
jgi:hypothetical protein